MINYILRLKTNVKPRPSVMVFLYGKITKGGDKMKNIIFSMLVACGLIILLTGYETHMSEGNKKNSTFNQLEVQNVLTNSVAMNKSQQIQWNQTR